LRGDEGAIGRIMAGLTDKQRLEAWVLALRRAGGLAFKNAETEAKREVFGVEQTTPKEGRNLFLTYRNTVLALNALLSMEIGRFRLRTEALLARITALVSLMLVADAEGGQTVLQQVLDGPTVKPDSRIDRAQAEAQAVARLAGELSIFSGAMLAYDESPLRHYWAEVLLGGPMEEPGFPAVDLALLAQNGREAIDRCLGEYIKLLHQYVQRPLEIRDRFVSEMVAQATSLPVADCLVQPVDAQLDRNAALAEALEPVMRARQIAVEESAEVDVSVFIKIAQRPGSYLLTLSVINAYEAWLYPPNTRGWGADRTAALEWQPWQDAYRGMT